MSKALDTAENLSSLSSNFTSSTLTLDSIKISNTALIETSTVGKVKQKGSFLQNSFHQALVLGE
jgi:hypothetical protein